MTTLLHQVTLTNDNTIPADAAVNTWHSLSIAVDRLDDALAFSQALVELYDGLNEYLSPALDDTIVIKTYDLADAVPRAPILTHTDTITTPTGTPLPNECAVALSYRATIVSGDLVGRNRGRIFLGPLNTAAMAGVAGLGGALVSSSFMTVIASNAQDLIENGESETWKWAVFSPTNAGTPPWDDAALLFATKPVTSFHIDNAFDTIRSRGIEATDRVSWP